MWDNILSSVMEGKVEEAGRFFEESAKSFFDPNHISSSSNNNNTTTTTTTTTKNKSAVSSSSSAASVSDLTATVDNTSATAAIAVQPKILEAAKKGNKEEVKRTVEAGANLDARDSNGMCALHLAAWNGHKEIVRYLLSKGASPQARSKQGSTPVHAASEKGYTDIVRMLLDHEELPHHQHHEASAYGSMISAISNNEERQPNSGEEGRK